MSTDYATKYKTGRQRLLDLLADLKWHTWSALEKEAGNRYAARLLELKRLGYVIDDRESATGHGKDYKLLSLLPGAPQEKKVKILLDEASTEKLLSGQLTAAAKEAIAEALGSFRANKHKL